MSKFSEYAKLIRPYGILYLGLTPVFGAICNGEFGFFNLFRGQWHLFTFTGVDGQNSFWRAVFGGQ